MRKCNMKVGVKVTTLLLVLLTSSIYAQEKEYIVFPNFEVLGDNVIPPSNIERISSRMRAIFGDNNPSFILVIGDEKKTQEIRRRIKESNKNNWISKNDAIPVGNNAYASKIVFAEVSKSRNGYELNLQFVDLEKGYVSTSKYWDANGDVDHLIRNELLEFYEKRLKNAFVEPKKKRGWIYVTGAVVIGAVTTGVILMTNKGNDKGLPTPPSPPSN